MCIRDRSSDKRSWEILMQPLCVARLVGHLRLPARGDIQTPLHACRTVFNLASSVVFIEPLGEAGVIPELLALANVDDASGGDGPKEIRALAVAALSRLFATEQNAEIAYGAGGLGVFVEMLSKARQVETLREIEHDIVGCLEKLCHSAICRMAFLEVDDFLKVIALALSASEALRGCSCKGTIAGLGTCRFHAVRLVLLDTFLLFCEEEIFLSDCGHSGVVQALSQCIDEEKNISAEAEQTIKVTRILVSLSKHNDVNRVAICEDDTLLQTLVNLATVGCSAKEGVDQNVEEQEEGEGDSVAESAALVLATLATEESNRLRMKDCILSFVKSVTDPNCLWPVKKQILNAINFLSLSPENRNEVRQADGVRAVVALFENDPALDSDGSSVVLRVLDTLMFTDANKDAFFEAKGNLQIQLLLRDSNSDKNVQESVWFLRHFVHHSDYARILFETAGFVPALVRRLSGTNGFVTSKIVEILQVAHLQGSGVIDDVPTMMDALTKLSESSSDPAVLYVTESILKRSQL
eukprot:TRINITY_DN6064_c0_g5_i1.p1 TRINITY_DN6064_c0_g5~~TRINITY_DN6064_c0_g5_i1.p1  ORF type:complete len:525 (+),score=75.80 TRINITY_DN6064_c0_g5_i1:3-1577(+)